MTDFLRPHGLYVVSLDVAGCGSLAMLNCAGNLLRSLQLSSLQRLRSIDASMNPLSELDLGACPAFFLDSITAVGDGFVCASSELDGSMLYASANRGSVFTGWYGETGEPLMAQTVKNPATMQGTQVQSLGQEDPLEKGMATHSSILAGRISP